MDQVYQTLSLAVDRWDFPPNSNNDSIEVTEFWLHHASNEIQVDPRRTVGPDDRERWLNERTMGSGDNARSILARFVWLVADKDKNEINISKSVQKDLLEKFGLKLAHKYFKTFVSGVAALPTVSKKDADQRAYAFCYGPKIAAIWSHSVFKDSPSSGRVTEGLIFCGSGSKENSTKASKPGKETAGKEKNFAGTIQKMLEATQWGVDICRNPAFPAYLFSMLLSRQIDETQADIGEKTRQVESGTGFHAFSTRAKRLENEELLGLSAKTSGYATKLASVNRKSKVVSKLLAFIGNVVDGDKSYLEQWGYQISDSDVNGGRLLKANASVLRERLEMQTMETEYALKRVQIQIEALFNLISQSDNINNYQLSLATRDIALTSQRDASSMKTLAVVTMFFLPGSFISALFSTPCFAWDSVDLTERDSIGVPPTPQFQLYWAVTIPLTLVTFVLYFIWLWFQKQQQKNEQERRKQNAPSWVYARYPARNGTPPLTEAEMAMLRRGTVDLDGARQSSGWKDWA